MEYVPIFDDNNTRCQKFISFTAFSDENSSLPFPLNLGIFWRLFISAVLVIIFFHGIRFRLQIVSYIRCPETKMNEVNILYCLDQINGLFLAVMLACGICFTLLTVPVAKLIDPSVCYLNGISHGLYLSGTFIWRCCIAIYRVLFIKAQRWMTDKMGQRNLLGVMIVFGLALMTGYTNVSATFNRYSYSKRSCNRWSDEDVDIIKSYQVLYFKWL